MPGFPSDRAFVGVTKKPAIKYRRKRTGHFRFIRQLFGLEPRAARALPFSGQLFEEFFVIHRGSLGSGCVVGIQFSQAPDTRQRKRHNETASQSNGFHAILSCRQTKHRKSTPFRP
jgi:hypothetical protein